MSDKYDGTKFKSGGEPTNQYMKWLYENDTKQFEAYQDEFFNTRSNMKSNPLKDIATKIMKGKKDAK